MKNLKRVVAVLGVAFGSLALFYICFARSLTLKNFGLSVEAQLIAPRIITPLLFAALGALTVSCEYFRRVRLRSGAKTGILVRILRLVAVVVLPVAIVIFSLQTPFWSFQSPDTWDRPRFIYGWFLPWKGEPAMTGIRTICPFLNLFLWALYLMMLVGYRRAKHYLIMLGVMLVLFGLYAKVVGIKTVYRQRVRSADGQSVSASIRQTLPASTSLPSLEICEGGYDACCIAPPVSPPVEDAMNHGRLKPTRLCILFRGENDMVQRSARNQRPVTLKTCYNTRVFEGSASPLVSSETGV